MFLSLNFLCLSLIQASYFIHAFPTKDVESDLGATLIMPLQNRAKSTPGGYLDLPAMANHIREKHGFPTVEPPDPEESDSLQRRATSNNVDLSDDGPDVSYFATISVGTPRMYLSFTLLLAVLEMVVIVILFKPKNLVWS